MSAGYQVDNTQNQVDEVMGIMRNNIDKVLERDTKIQNLNERSDALQVGAHQFQQTGTQLKRKMWWKNVKFMIIIGVVVVVILGIVIGIIVSQTKKKKSN